MIKRIISRLTMKRLSCQFIDRVSGKEVFLYVDCYHQHWLAEFHFLTSMRIRKHVVKAGE